MKTFLLTFMFTLTIYICSSQTIPELFNESKSQFQYIILADTQKPLSSKRVFTIIDGTSNNGSAEHPLSNYMDDSDKIVNYVQALNLFGAHGWEMMSVEVKKTGATLFRYTYLKRKVE